MKLFLKEISKINKILYISIIAFILFNSLNLLSQSATDTSEVNSPIIGDTIYIKYHFDKGDTLIYHVESHDSISINYDTPLNKYRYETLRIICDSITKEGRYILRHDLITFRSNESVGDTEVKRTTNPWLYRKVWIEIDSVGNRYSYKLEDSTGASLCPGGAFQPYLFFPFVETCKRVNESWMVRSSDYLAENGYPVPTLNTSSLLRMMDTLDTLNELCNRFQYVKTGRGHFTLLTENDKIAENATINSYGNMYISKEKNIPIFYFANVEQKLSIATKDEALIPGNQYTVATFTLIDYKKASIKEYRVGGGSKFKKRK